MTNTTYSMAIRAVTATVCGTLLAACGGGGGSSTSGADGTAALIVSSVDAARLAERGNVTKDPVKDSAQTPPATSPAGAAITSVRLENTTATAQTGAPFTFGQVFSAGHLAKGVALTGRLENGETVQLQVDAKAFHADGSVRHAIISGVVPSLGANQVRKMELVRAASPLSGTGASTAQLINSGFTTSVSATIGGVRYTASADELIKAGKATSWLAGSTVNEWHVSAPLKTAAGVEHPHLSARFAIRWFDASKKARVDVTVENSWAYEASPSNFTYDAEILVGGASVYTKPALTHLHHARWRKVFWSGAAAADVVNVKLDTAYLIATGAVPNYDQSIVIKEATLASWKAGWTGAKTEPMGVGNANPYMPSTGGRDDIGLLPGWGTAYLLSMDSRARLVTMGTADLAGSWSMHYRDKLTDRPVSIIDYPYMTIAGTPGDTYNPVTKKREAFPTCATTTACTTPNNHDTSHQPGFAYLPYLVTGDYYYLEELQFWAMYNVLAYNPIYRETSKGILQSNQVRGQAWSLRSLAQAAYITPDADKLKSQFIGFVDNNLAWYNQTYTDNAQANALGVLLNSAVVYSNGTGIAPWQDDFFTAAVGYTADLGFPEAKRLLTWKAQYPVKRMNNQGLCWIDGAMYSMIIRNSSTAPVFTTMQEVADASQLPALRALSCGSTEMASYLKLKVGEMTGYSTSDKGYPSNMQPALAYAATVSGAEGQSAWSNFMKRSVKPDYSSSPQFAIVPR